jgi:hypothetical protein
MTKKRLRCLAAVLTLSCGTAWGAAALSPPEREILVGRSFANRAVPKWENGFIVGYDSDLSIVYSFDRRGEQAISAQVSPPGAVRASIFDVTVSPAGVLVAAGGALHADGAQSGFLAWITASGRVERFVRTAPFAPQRVCFATDGGVWAFGYTLSPDLRVEVAADTLRHYDAQGKLVRSTLPKDSFSGPSPFPASYLAHLVSNGSRVGVYSVNKAEWVEVTAAGEVAGRWKTLDHLPEGADPNRVRATGVAFLPSGEVYASYQHAEAAPPSKKREYRTVFRVLDRNSGQWTPVDAAPYLESRPGALYGADGEYLVVSKGLPYFHWVRLR